MFDKYTLSASVHTLQIWTEDEINQEALKQFVAGQIVNSYRCSLSGEKKFLVLNLNKIHGDIFSFREFCQVFDEVKNYLGIRKYHLQRTDFRFDSYEPDFFEKCFKIHRYIFTGLDYAFKFKNNYKVEDFYSEKDLSLTLKGRSFQVEFYNRQVKNIVMDNTKEQAQSRLEVRSLSRIWSSYRKKYSEIEEIELIQREFQEIWQKRFQKAIEALQCAEDRVNQTLLSKWQKGQAESPQKYRNYIDFLCQNQELIFTRKQAVGLLKQMGIANPKKAVDNFVDRYKPKFFLKKEISKIQREIKKSTRDYFRN